MVRSPAAGRARPRKWRTPVSPAGAGCAVRDDAAHLWGFAGSALVLMTSWINVLKCQFTNCLSARRGPLNLLVGFLCYEAGLAGSC